MRGSQMLYESIALLRTFATFRLSAVIGRRQQPQPGSLKLGPCPLAASTVDPKPRGRCGRFTAMCLVPNATVAVEGVATVGETGAVDGLNLHVANAPRGVLREHADEAISVLLAVVPKTVRIEPVVAFVAHDREGGILLLATRHRFRPRNGAHAAGGLSWWRLGLREPPLAWCRLLHTFVDVVVGVRQLNARQAALRAHEVWRWSKVLRVAKLFTVVQRRVNAVRICATTTATRPTASNSAPSGSFRRASRLCCELSALPRHTLLL